MKKVLVIIAALALLSTGSIQAMSSQGPTGLVEMATADVLNAGTLEVSYQSSGSRATLGVTAGLIPNLELGIANVSNGNDSRFHGHVKYRLISETSEAPALSVGLLDKDYYLVASKTLAAYGIRGHVGVGSGDGLFGGVSKVLNPVSVSTSRSRIAVPTMAVSAEYHDEAFNLGLSMAFDPDIRLNVNLHDLKTVGVGVGFRIGF